MGLGSSLIYSQNDFTYLFHGDAPFSYKARVTLTYSRLTAQFFLCRALRLRPTRAKVMGQRFHFNDFPTFAFLFREIYVKREYRAKLRRAPVIIDCGANIGVSVAFFKREHPDATIYAFEPLPDNYAMLEKNVAGMRKVIAFEQAVAAKDGHLDFYFDERSPAALTSSVYRSRGGQARVRVRAKRLSTFVHKVRPDLIKMDIEGAEMGVLEDLDSTGALRHVKTLLIEYHHNLGNGSSLAEFLGILERNGFLYTIDAPLSPRKGFEDLLICASKS